MPHVLRPQAAATLDRYANLKEGAYMAVLIASLYTIESDITPCIEGLSDACYRPLQPFILQLAINYSVRAAIGILAAIVLRPLVIRLFPANQRLSFLVLSLSVGMVVSIPGGWLSLLVIWGHHGSFG
jgi:hypothetical protein